MHIIVDARLVLPYMTGIGRYLLGLISRMQAELQDDQLEIWLQQALPANHQVWAMNSTKIQTRQIPIKHMDPRAHWLIPRMLSQTPADLFHYPHFDLPWFTAGKSVITIHDLKYIRHPEFFQKGAWYKHILLKIMLTHALSGAKKILTGSQFTAQEIQEVFGINSSKIQVTPYGVDERFFRHLSSEALARVQHKYQLPEKHALVVGERRPHKNLTSLIKAFNIFHKKNNLPLSLVIAGKAYAGYREPEELVGKLGLEHQVHFLDYVEDHDLPAIYQNASLFIMLSQYEGFGLPILEAMASGVPVIAANLTALPEVVGEAGILVDPGDPGVVAFAMHSLLAESALRETFIAKGKVRAGQFTWENCAQQTLQVYHSLGQV